MCDISDKLKRPENLFPYVAIITTVFFVWWNVTRPLYLKIAFVGFSPIDWTNRCLHPEWFVRDFPSGIDNYASSVFMYIYPLLEKFAGIQAAHAMPAVIALEIIAMAIMSILLTRTLLPKASALLVALVTIAIIASSYPRPDLARFFFPFWAGLYYSAVEFFRVLAILFVLQKRYKTAGLMLAVAFAIHPAQTMIAAIVIAGVLIPRARQAIKDKNFALGFLIFLGVSAAWTLGRFNYSGMAGEGIPPNLWFELTRTFSFHWYPLALNVFTKDHQDVFLPLLSFLLPSLYYFWNSKSPFKREISCALLTILALSLAGILFSWMKITPILVKLSLHRSTGLVVFLLLPCLLNGLMEDALSFRTTGFLALCVLIGPFFSNGIPLITSCTFIAVKAFSPRPVDKPWVLLSAALLALGLFYTLMQWATPLSSPVYGGGRVSLYLLVIGTLLFIALRLPLLKKVSTTAFLLVLLMCAYNWSYHQRPSGTFLAQASSYKLSQEWARENTPVGALFLSDPTIYYGWRDFSQRPSFGNLREWLHTSWLYNSDKVRYSEGLRRLEVFGLAPEPYLYRGEAITGFTEMSNDLRKRFYAMTDKDLANLMRKEKIDYLVMNNDEMRKNIRLPVAYRNSGFTVIGPTQVLR